MTKGAFLSANSDGASRGVTLQRIQILRFFAALAVIVFHANGTAPSYLPGKGFDLLTNGYAGVDIFFVISGFIICHIAKSRETDWRIFLVRRLERIVPLYWFITLVTYFLVSAAHLSRSGPMAFSHLIRSLAFVQWTAGPNASPIVFVGWSLEFEMFFYLVFALAMMLTPRPAETVAGLFAGAVIADNLFLPDMSSVATGFFVNPIILEFVFGILIAQVFDERRVDWRLALIVAVALSTTSFGGWGRRVWIGGVPGAILVAGALWLDMRFPLRRLIWRGAVKLGNASYSLYLVQALAISTAGRFLARFWPTINIVCAIVLISAAAVLLGYFCHIFGERPIGRWSRRGVNYLSKRNVAAVPVN